jgi:MFS family permease
VRTFLKNKVLVLATVGLVLLGTSMLWEYVRMRPEYRFIVEPWSLRGFETSQGILIGVGSALLLVITFLIVFDFIKESMTHAVALGLGMGAVAALIALVSGAKNATLGGFGVVVFTLLTVWAIDTAVTRFLLQDVSNKRLRRLIRLGIWVVGGLLLLLFVLGPLFGSDARPAWLLVLLAFLMLNTVAALRRPQGLATYRMVINGVLVLWLVSITSSAALRTALITAQRNQSGVAADVADAGITSGIIIAWVAGLVAFAGVVGLWAKRREEVEARERARRQLEAARESEAQLGAGSAG